MQPVLAGGQAAAQPVKVFLCPSRRNGVAGAKIDYATAHSVYNGLQDLCGGIDWSTGIDAYKTILSGKTFDSGYKGTSLPAVTAQVGASNTIMMAHKCMQTGDYNAANATGDAGWAITATSIPDAYRQHIRFLDKTEGPLADSPSLPWADGYSTPHTQVMPCLWGDGGVRMYTIGYTNGSTSLGANDVRSTWALLWIWNRSELLTAP